MASFAMRMAQPKATSIKPFKVPTIKAPKTKTPKVPKITGPKYSGRGTKARLNTAAEKMIFNTSRSNY